MSSMTLTAPMVRPRREVARGQRPGQVATLRAGTRGTGQRAGRPAAVTPRAVVAPRAARIDVPLTRSLRPRSSSRCARVASPSLRLTRRGRLAILTSVLAVAAAASLATGSVSLAGTSSSPVPARYVVVEGGDTLWSIAGDVAPDADRRDTVAEIVELNALAGSGVRAGQQLAVPAGR